MSLANTRKDDYNFKFADFLNREYQYDPRSDFKICEYYNSKGDNNTSSSSSMPNNQCPYASNSQNCPYGKHVIGNFHNKIVCKHWLKNLCKKNEQCEYLHEYNLRKMPECLFFSKNGYCNNNTNEDCPYQHIDPKTGLLINKHLNPGKKAPVKDTGVDTPGIGIDIDIDTHNNYIISVDSFNNSSSTNAADDEQDMEEECEAYNLGFCYMGPKCKFKHIRYNSQEYLKKLESKKTVEEVPEEVAQEDVVDEQKQKAQPETTTTTKGIKKYTKICPRYINGFCPVGKNDCEYLHLPNISSMLIINKLKIKPDSQINTKKSDALKEARLNAIINGEISI